MLRILLLEDDATDANLIVSELEASGMSFEIAQVETEADLRRELETHAPDVILSDHGLPAFSGFAALEIAREMRPDLPFIFVSGSNDQGMVAKMYELGATDYVFKKDLEDLAPALADALALEPPVETPATHAQSELKIRIPANPPAQTPFALPLGQLSFCPKCLRAREDSGQLVDLERYLGNHSEVTVYRQVCPACQPPRKKQ